MAEPSVQVSFYKSSILKDKTPYKVLGDSFYRTSSKKTSARKSVTPIPQISASWTPKQIYDVLDAQLYGNETYKKTISIFLWRILNGYRPKGALLTVGQSGCGKTELLRILEKIYPCMQIIDGANCINSSYTGENNIQANLYILKNKSQDYPNMVPILVIDEFDKYLTNNFQDTHNASALPELYRMIEGMSFPYRPTKNGTIETIDCTDVVCIFAGSFAQYAQSSISGIGFSNCDITHRKNAKVPTLDEVNKILPPELRGRIEDIIFIDEFDANDFANIMRNQTYSPLIRIGSEFGIKITATDAYIEQVANAAFDEGTGVRSLTTAVMREVNNKIFDNPNIKTIKLK